STHIHRERPRGIVTRAAAESSAASVIVAPKAAAAPPPIARGFQALTDPLPGARLLYDPPDVSGAVGPHHVVGAFNDAVVVDDRNGARLALVTIEQFWHDPALPDVNLFDTRVVYDAANDRWITAILGDDGAGGNGVVLLAISAGGDPTAGWRRYRF